MQLLLDQLAQIHLGLDGGAVVDRRPGERVARLGVGAVGDEEPQRLEMAGRRGVVQRGVVVGVAGEDERVHGRGVQRGELLLEVRRDGRGWRGGG